RAAHLQRAQARALPPPLLPVGRRRGGDGRLRHPGLRIGAAVHRFPLLSLRAGGESQNLVANCFVASRGKAPWRANRRLLHAYYPHSRLLSGVPPCPRPQAVPPPSPSVSPSPCPSRRALRARVEGCVRCASGAVRL